MTYIHYPRGTVMKNMIANAGDARDVGWIPRLGRSPRVGNGNPFQYFCLQNSMDRGAWQATVHGVAESDTTEHTAHDMARQLSSKIIIQSCEVQSGSH